MFSNCGNGIKLFRVGSAGLLAGCLWFTLPASALAQEQGVSQQTQRTDSVIQVDVVNVLSQDGKLHGMQIEATTAQGVVTLTGTVQTEAQRQQAETDAANVPGVSGILNNLKVNNPSAAPAPDTGLAAQEAANQLSDQTNNQTTADSDASVPPPPPDEEVSPNQPATAPPYNNGPRPAYQPQQGYAPVQQPYYAQPRGPVTIPAGTLLRVRLSEPLDTKQLKDGAFFQATVAVDVYQSGVLAIPRGATLTGKVIESKNAGELGGSAVLRLQLANINLEGHIYPINTDVWSSKGPNKAGYTAGNTAGGAVLGALIGGIIGRGAGAAVGAGVGGVAGLAASSATTGPRIMLPPETQVDFHLMNPVTVQPVSWQEAQRLASSTPQLVVRPRPVYVVPGPYYGPYPYPYPY